MKFKEVKIRTVILIYFITILIMSAIIFFIMAKFGPNISQMTLLILKLVMDLMIMIMLVFTFKPTIRGIKVLLRDVINKADKKEIIYVVIFKLLVALGGGKMLIDFLHLIDENFINSFMADMIIKVDGPIQYAISVVILCLLCPIIEELIFRNIIFKRISKKFNAYIGVIISSIVFATINIGNGIAGAFLFGIANCIIYTKYKNIFMPVLVNFSYNLLLVILVIPFFGNNANYILFSTRNAGISLLVAFLMFATGIFLFIKFFIKNKKYMNEYNIELRNNLEMNTI